MASITRLPALPLIVNDPYLSLWMPADTLTAADPVHWSGAAKPMWGDVRIDGREYGFLGRSSRAEMTTVRLDVTPTRTISVFEAAGVRLTLTFTTPMLPDDLDTLSMPVTMVDFRMESIDGQEHQAEVRFDVSTALCYDGAQMPPLLWDSYTREGLRMAYIGQRQQKVLSQSGDRLTIDWGYLYLASPWDVTAHAGGLGVNQTLTVSTTPVDGYALVGYDDVAAINYFGTPCHAWYQRNGRTLPDALCTIARNHDTLLRRCEMLDKQVLDEAEAIGGADYRLICAASWRHTFAAHKLIATPAGEMALLSKENDSNGCIGTVDVSYPSIPLFLKYCPELVNALCRPVLEFASMPVWEEKFAPHDVGRYPHATGQVYAARKGMENGGVHPPYYLYPAGCDVYDPRYQMPVEECGNMLIMLETAVAYGAEDGLLRKYRGLLDGWVAYLHEYGEDPGEQLCTDDFAGHLAHNVNLSAKAIVGMMCYSRIVARLGEADTAGQWETRAREMAASWLKRADVGDHTALTFTGEGWSMKYNLVWDLVLGLDLLPRDFYRRETESYLPRLNEYGLPLDSRADYTKSDWTVWCAAMVQDNATLRGILAPLANYLRTTTTRVPFSDWYDTKTGRYVAFIARSVQGGVFMPMLRQG